MCGGHHGRAGPAQCCCGEGHPQHGCGCRGHPHHGWGRASHCCCGGGHGHHGSAGAPDCCCGGHAHQGCGCGHPFGFRRLFPTKEDEAVALEQYLKDLEDEAKGVRERLTELREA